MGFKIKDLCDADINIVFLEITVRINGKFVEEYHIGDRGWRPNEEISYWRPAGECKAGYYFENRGMKYLFIDRCIQYHFDPPKNQRGYGGYGVITERIPRELLDLPVDLMRPDTWYKDETHGYVIESEVKNWAGISEEFEQVKLDLDVEALT